MTTIPSKRSRRLSTLLAITVFVAACRDASGPSDNPVERQRALWRRWVETSVFTYDSLNTEGSLCTRRGTEPVFEPSDTLPDAFVCGEIYFSFPSGTPAAEVNAIAASGGAQIRRVSPGVPRVVDGYASVIVPAKTEKAALLRFLETPKTTGLGLNLIFIIG